MAVIFVGERTVKLVALSAPNLTEVSASLKFVPRIVTLAPPAVGPLAGDTFVTDGTSMWPKLTTWTVPELAPLGENTVSATLKTPFVPPQLNSGELVSCGDSPS